MWIFNNLRAIYSWEKLYSKCYSVVIKAYCDTHTSFLIYALSNRDLFLWVYFIFILTFSIKICTDEQTKSLEGLFVLGKLHFTSVNMGNTFKVSKQL